MKNIIKSALLLLCTIGLFTACNDDREHNPTIQQPKTFVLNTPAYATSLVDLATSSSMTFTWSQPAYGFPAVATYQVQISANNTWTKDIQAGEIDAQKKPVGDYKTFDEEYTTVKAELSATDIATALEQITHYAQNAVPATQKMYVRVRAAFAGDTILSNTVTVNVAPYYVELKDAAPVEWYLVGSCIGNGTWANNGMANVGQSLMPLYMIDGQEYDRKTGTGKISYTGFFPAGGQFKLIKEPGSWGTQIDYDKFTNVNGNSNFDKSSDGNVIIQTAGYYTVTVDTKASTASITPYTGSTTQYAAVFLAGDHNSWNATSGGMDAISTYTGAENHNWTTTVTFNADGEFKFSDGTLYWGGIDFPYGTASTTGGKIKYSAGTYTVFFNDITGQYYFIAADN
ncbi:MAG: SusE domain-containing protein [Prevotella sp.]|nr:SusE domain-containing protein [Prevotella sp.]